MRAPQGMNSYTEDMSGENHDIFTVDSLFSGRLQCVQHKEGYRFSIDAVLLSHFAEPKPGNRILDLCAGCGIVSMVMAYRKQHIRVAALEVQPALVELIKRNIAMNGFEDRYEIVAGDLLHIENFLPPQSFDMVVCNPPYRKSETGRVNHGDEQAVCRHEIKADLQGVIRAMSFALKNRGRGALVYPAERSASLISELRKQRLEPKKMRIVHSYPGSEGKLILLEAMKGGGEELTILPPLYVYEKQGGDYSPEVADYYRP